MKKIEFAGKEYTLRRLTPRIRSLMAKSNGYNVSDNFNIDIFLPAYLIACTGLSEEKVLDELDKLDDAGEYATLIETIVPVITDSNEATKN